MSNNAINIESDLDWLARVLHKWPDCDGITLPGRGCSFFDTGVGRSVHVYAVDGSDYTTIKEKDWLARRAELQNKPSWKDAPEWAQWLAKDSPDKDEESAWWWYADKPVSMKNTWQVSTDGRAMMASFCHLNLGDWRDTLEKRPADLSEQAVTKRPVNPAPATDWHKRGELPPAGTAVQLWHGGTYAYDCELIAKRGNDFVLWNLTWERPDSADCMMCDFRPLRTERDDLVDVLTNAGIGSYAFLVADAILAAGYRKDPK